MAKKYLSLERLTEYDDLIKVVISEGDAATLSSAKTYTDDEIDAATLEIQNSINAKKDNDVFITYGDSSKENSTHTSTTIMEFVHSGVSVYFYDGHRLLYLVYGSEDLVIFSGHYLKDGKIESITISINTNGQIVSCEQTSQDIITTSHLEAVLADAEDYADDIAAGKADEGHTHNDLYYTKDEIDNMVFVTIEDIDTICGATVVAASLDNEVVF